MRAFFFLKKKREKEKFQLKQKITAFNFGASFFKLSYGIFLYAFSLFFIGNGCVFVRRNDLFQEHYPANDGRRTLFCPKEWHGA